MRKSLAVSLLPSCILVLLLITACQKVKILDPLPPCQITRIVIPSDLLVAANRVEPRTYIPKRIAARPVHVFNVASGTADTINFTYNKYGNPTSMTHKQDIGENALFRYDGSNRLREYINIFSNGAGDFWHRYAYDKVKTDQIIADTAFRDFISSNGQLIDYNDIDLTTFKYDSLYRIIKSTEYVNGDTIVRTYTYDGNGNRQYSGATYDNKPNIHLTNGIWMFIDREFSIHNPTDHESYTYNTTGYPLTINNSSNVVPGLGFIIIGYPFAITRASFFYSCSSNQNQNNQGNQNNQ